MSRALIEPPPLPPLDEATARANADALRRIGAGYGISDLRFASPGRIIGHLKADRGMGDMALFQRDIEDLLGVHADFFTDGLLGKPGVSADLLAARPL
ncbi:MAG: hypothetical protein M3070_16240 [Actinomycetota bacterium]|nr:hypothetical protein [Actinomycetota bacterium]